MAQFDIAYSKTGKHEGGYSFRATDRGGETYRGISRKFHSEWKGWAIIDRYKDKPSFPALLDTDELLQNEVRDFYMQGFWNILRLNEITDQDIANELYDTGVNCGNYQAIKFLQRSLNLLNNKQKLYPDITVDGFIGVKTLEAVSKVSSDVSLKDALVICLNGFQFYHYASLADADKSQEEYFKGWILKRVNLSADV